MNRLLALAIVIRGLVVTIVAKVEALFNIDLVITGIRRDRNASKPFWPVIQENEGIY